jgi:hypothetical protein
MGFIATPERKGEWRYVISQLLDLLFRIGREQNLAATCVERDTIILSQLLDLLFRIRR